MPPLTRRKLYITKRMTKRGNCMGSCRWLVSIDISALAMIPQQGNGPDGLPKGFRAVGILCQEVGALLKAKQLQELFFELVFLIKSCKCASNFIHISCNECYLTFVP